MKNILSFLLLCLFCLGATTASAKNSKAKYKHASAKHHARKSAHHKPAKSPQRKTANRGKAQQYFDSAAQEKRAKKAAKKNSSKHSLQAQEYVKNFKTDPSMTGKSSELTEIPVETTPNAIPDQASNMASSSLHSQANGQEYYDLTPPAGVQNDSGSRFPYERVHTGYSTAFPDIERPEPPQAE